MDAGRLTELIEGSDLDGLIRFVDNLCSARDWDGLVELVARCREATQRGKQVWAAAEFAEYRIALEAPAEFVGAVVAEGAGRYSLGPLWEVAASTHTWSELEPHLSPGPARAMVAHERVVRGEDLSGAEVDPVLELPLRLKPWEPDYAVATYRADKADFPEPDVPASEPTEAVESADVIDDLAATDALQALVSPWVDESNGRAAAIAVEGSALAAAAGIGAVAGARRLSGPEALAYMAWTGASGGAHGRRRGSPVGRYNAWWVAAELGGLEGLHDPGHVAEAVESLAWYRWEPPGLVGGWRCHLAVEDPERGLAWALAATDEQDEDIAS